MTEVNLNDKAYKYLRELIVSNQLLPGSAIVEKDICSLLNISRTPVREAFRRLEAEGVLIRNQRQKKGTFVRDVTYADILEISEIRKLFELYALPPCVNNISDADIGFLETKFNSLREDSSKETFFDADRELHRIIMSYCLNSRMLGFLNNINAQLERLRRISGGTPNRLPASKKEHQDILEAIKARDIVSASRSLDFHLENVKTSILTSYQQIRTDVNIY